MSKLTVLFENPFWVGVFEKFEDNKIQVCRVVFGQEPKDYEVYEFVLKNYNHLKFSRPLLINEKPIAKINPKRIQRKIKKTVQEQEIGTKAQQALKLDYESNKLERKFVTKEKREMQEKIKFLQKQNKKKQKKRGH